MVILGNAQKICTLRTRLHVVEAKDIVVKECVLLWINNVRCFGETLEEKQILNALASSIPGGHKLEIAGKHLIIVTNHAKWSK